MGIARVGLEALQRKYTELTRKYESVVSRVAALTTERIGVVALAISAMRATQSALALRDSGRLLFANQRWTELAHGRQPLTSLNDPGALPARATATQIAEAGTAAILGTAGPAVITARYGWGDGRAQTWDFRFELTSYANHAAVLIIVTDASEAVRAERELEEARRRMAEQERLRTIGLLAAGVAHDFANALNAAGLHVRLLRGANGDASREKHCEALHDIIEAMSERTRRLRALALERQELTIDRVELGSVVAAAAELTRAEFGFRDRRTTRIDVDPAVATLPPVRGASAELQHVLLNLLLNARDAMPDGGTVRIGGWVDGDFVVLDVADEGPGIPPEHLQRIFEPFFTTKGDAGTGLGLATAYGLMRAIGGEITAANGGSRGATFSLRFRRWTA